MTYAYNPQNYTSNLRFKANRYFIPIGLGNSDFLLGSLSKVSSTFDVAIDSAQIGVKSTHEISK
jgi:hypothetical protein